jgi:hydrogenase nickel incorporation protein HypA/HybF
MHELSIAIAIIEAVEEEVERRGYCEIQAIHLRVGPLSGVVPEALRSAYELAAEQTSFAHSRLVIEDVPVVVDCPTCGRHQPVESMQSLCCAVCETPASDVVSGRELEISALELAA